MSRLAPLSEEPTNEEDEYTRKPAASAGSRSNGHHQKWRKWLKSLHLFNKLKSDDDDDLKILLSVLGCPLSPVTLSLLHPKPQQSITQVSSSAQYIIEHFIAATGSRKLTEKVKNVYATGKVRMVMADDQIASTIGGATSATNGVSQKGCFVIWQMVPNKWLIELVVGGHKVVAGSDGNVAWRHTPWLGSHAAKGGVRPLRRALQGLDPVAVSAVFSPAQYMGEKRISDVDCFVLKLSADQTDLVDRSDNTAEMIKHVIFGYFSQRSGLLVFLEDSYLTRIQSPGTYPTYWETTMATKIEDYRTVEGVMIAHAGESSVIITRFGDNIKAGPMITRMEETWTIDDLAFNVPGLSMDCFIPPDELQNNYPDENNDWRSPLHQ